MSVLLYWISFTSIHFDMKLLRKERTFFLVHSTYRRKYQGCEINNPKFCVSIRGMAFLPALTSGLTLKLDKQSTRLSSLRSWIWFPADTYTVSCYIKRPSWDSRYTLVGEWLSPLYFRNVRTSLSFFLSLSLEGDNMVVLEKRPSQQLWLVIKFDWWSTGLTVTCQVSKVQSSAEATISVTLLHSCNIVALSQFFFIMTFSEEGTKLERATLLGLTFTEK